MLKLKKLLLKEGILDGLKPAFIIDSGLNESAVKGRKASLSLPRFSVWGFHNNGSETPKLMENGYSAEALIDKHGLTKEDVYPIEGSMSETIKKVGKSKWGVYAKKGGKRLGTHDNKEQAKNQQSSLDSSKAENKNTPKNSLNG